MPRHTAQRFPDFRNFGVMLRALLLVGAAWLLGVVWEQRWPITATAGAEVLYWPIALSVLAVWTLVGPRLRGWRYRWAVVASLALAGATGLAWQVLAHEGLALQLGSSALRTLGATLLVAALVLVYFDWRFHRLSPALSEARLVALQSRIQPHFLFNSLNSVLALIRVDAARAERSLEDLADLFRALLADGRTLVPLGDELALARAYVNIETVRLGERLRVTWLCDQAPTRALVPPLLLQPLLENAVRYGCEPLPEGADISCEIYTDDNQLVIFVRNPEPGALPTGYHGLPGSSGFPGQTPPRQRHSGHQIGLANIRERLALHFDAEANLKTYTSNGEFVVQVQLPLVSSPRQTATSAPGLRPPAP